MVSATIFGAKTGLSKLIKLAQNGAEAFERMFLEAVSGAGYTLLAIDAAIALRAGRLAGKHGDPFDSMIAAQALADDLLLLSNDTKLDRFGVRRLW